MHNDALQVDRRERTPNLAPQILSPFNWLVEDTWSQIISNFSEKGPTVLEDYPIACLQHVGAFSYWSCSTLRASVKRNRNIMPKDISSHYFCGHCKDYVGKSTFYKHKKRYYNHSAWTWRFAETAKSQPGKTSGASTFMDPDDISFADEECLAMFQGMSAFCIMGLTFRS